jgi:large repetitive protein
MAADRSRSAGTLAINNGLITTNSASGTGADTFAVTSGQLPDHLQLDPATGIISGTPDTSGSATFTITVTDAIGAFVRKTYTLAAL